MLARLRCGQRALRQPKDCGRARRIRKDCPQCWAVCRCRREGQGHRAHHRSGCGRRCLIVWAAASLRPTERRRGRPVETSGVVGRRLYGPRYGGWRAAGRTPRPADARPCRSACCRRRAKLWAESCGPHRPQFDQQRRGDVGGHGAPDRGHGGGEFVAHVIYAELGYGAEAVAG